ncbi:MAG: hypothetical protein HW411_431 [Gammaproteobacteria bacterium]|nr:hypothetical protein [Gammaproteobacteria bacterium]
MPKKTGLKPIVTALGTTFVVSFAASPIVNAEENPFALNELSHGYMVVEHDAEGKCGGEKESEGKCGENKEAEAKCGNKMDPEGKCGEGKCGEKRKEHEGKCGEGKCGNK